MNNFNVSPETEYRLVAAGFFPLTPVYWQYSKEWHFEDHTGRGRDLRVTDTGVASFKGAYEGDTKHLISYGCIRVDTERELVSFLQDMGWL